MDQPIERLINEVVYQIHFSSPERIRIDATWCQARGIGMIKIITTGLVLLALNTSAKADFNSAVTAYDRGDYTTALREFRTLANTGMADAQYNVGFMYFNGRGVPKDLAKAAQWYRAAAEQGHAQAQVDLAIAYMQGQGVLRDLAEAVKWYGKAAEQGHVSSQYNVGLMYFLGQGVPQDFAAAARWMERAAEQGHASAQSTLGIMYSKGLGLPKENVLAYMWLSLAISNLPVGRVRDQVIRKRNLIGQNLSAAQIAGAQRLALTWMEKHNKK